MVLVSRSGVCVVVNHMTQWLIRVIAFVCVFFGTGLVGSTDGTSPCQPGCSFWVCEEESGLVLEHMCVSLGLSWDINPLVFYICMFPRPCSGNCGMSRHRI